MERGIANQPVKQNEISRVRDEINVSLESLQKHVGVLEGRLSHVMTQQPPTVGQDKLINPTTNTQFGISLLEIKHKINDIESWINNILSRLEI